MQRSILIACFFLYAHCLSQQYPFVHYTPREGLVNNRARFVFQDSKGKLYIATYGGLSVYDGSRFVNYTANNGLAVNLVNCLAEMGDDSIWIMTNDHKIHCLVRGKLKDLHTADNYVPIINNLIKASDGYYYAFADDGLFRLQNNKFTKITLRVPGTGEIKTLLEGAEIDKKLYILVNPDYKEISQKLLAFDLTQQKLVGYDTSKIIDLFHMGANEVWITMWKGIYHIIPSADKNQPIKLEPLPDSFHVPKGLLPAFAYRDRQNNLWLSNAEGVYRIRRNGQVTLFSTDNGLNTNYQNNIFQDYENNMWFANEQTGLSKLSNQQFSFYPVLKPGYAATDIFIPHSSDSVWMHDVRRHKMTLVPPSGIMQQYSYEKEPLSYRGLFVSGNKKWVAYGKDIFEWEELVNSGHYTLRPFYEDSANDIGFSSAIADHNGNLVAVSNKVVVVAGDKVLSEPINYLADEVTVDKNNRIWAATRSNQLFCFQLSGHGNEVKLSLLKSYTRPLLGSPRSITSDQAGNIWVGTRDQGLYCIQLDGLNIKSLKQLTTINGLSENFIGYLYCDKENNIWACSPSGLDKIKMENDHFRVENITGSNNLYIPISKVQQTAKGLFWILSDAGVITYDPERPTMNGWRPRLSFSEKVFSNKEAMPVPLNRRLKFFQNNLSFQLSAPSFIDEKQTRFSYLLEGSGNKNWSTPSRDASINLVNLPPGEYILKAKAIFLHGLYPDIESSYSFVILPPWWQTWWFKLIMGMVILALGFLGLRFYINRRLALQRTTLEKRRAIEKERTRIATDMHDDLGAGLSQIKFLSEAIGMKKQKHLPIEEEISSIRTFSVEMIDKMGEIVWALNEKNDTLSDLLSYTRSYAVAYLEQNGLTCHFEEPDDIPQDYVSSEFRRNIYLTVKESLHNIVKHAQATEVLIDVHITNCLAIQIKDNGVGFDSTKEKSMGNGLVSMNARMRELKGRFEIINNNGTEINILVPLN